MTLVDSAKCAEASLKRLGKDMDLDTSFMTLKEIFGRGFDKNAVLISERNNNKVDWKTIMKKNIELVKEEYANSEIRGKDIISELNESGIKVGIISNSEKQAILTVLKNPKNTGIKIDIVYGFDDKALNETKADLIKRAISKLEVEKDEAVYVGDHSNDILVAKEAGVKSVGITTGFHTRQELKSLDPDAIIDDLSELKNILS